MAVQLVNPDNHVQIPIYHHVSVATGSRFIHLAGQVAWNERGELVGECNLTEQIVQLYRNVQKGLAAADATFSDVVRITWYAAGWRRKMYDAFNAGVQRATQELGITTNPPLALIGVEILFEQRILIEAEVTAIA